MNRTPPTTRTSLSRLTRPLAVVLAIAALGSTATSAWAQDPTSAQYETSVTRAAGGVGGGSAPAHRTSGLQKTVVGGLPFTGLDLIALVAVALAFTSVGFALRRLTVSRDA